MDSTLRSTSVGKNPAHSHPLAHCPTPLYSMPQDLSEALKEATKEVHVQAENAEFMKNFQKGEVTREGFKVCVVVVPAVTEGNMMDVGVRLRLVV